MAETKLTLKEMCEMFDVTPRTLRYYEYIELLAPEKQGRKRFYGNVEKARLKLILNGRRWGFSLEEIRQWLLLYRSQGRNLAQTKAWVESSGKQLAELEQRKAQLEETIEELSRFHIDAKNQLKKLEDDS